MSIIFSSQWTWDRMWILIPMHHSSIYWVTCDFVHLRRSLWLLHELSWLHSPAHVHLLLWMHWILLHELIWHVHHWHHLLWILIVIHHWGCLLDCFLFLCLFLWWFLLSFLLKGNNLVWNRLMDILFLLYELFIFNILRWLNSLFGSQHCLLCSVLLSSILLCLHLLHLLELLHLLHLIHLLPLWHLHELVLSWRHHRHHLLSTILLGWLLSKWLRLLL